MVWWMVTEFELWTGTGWTVSPQDEKTAVTFTGEGYSSMLVAEAGTSLYSQLFSEFSQWLLSLTDVLTRVRRTL